MNAPIPEAVTRIFETYRRIHNEVIAAHPKLDRWYLIPTDRFQIEGPNPYYGKTTSGYVVEWYYGHPNKVHTPDGQFTYFSGCSSVPPKEALEEIDTRLAAELGLALAREEKYTTGPCGGVVGPFYRVVGTESFVVPEVASPFLDGKEPDSTTKLSNLVEVLTALNSLNASRTEEVV